MVMFGSSYPHWHCWDVQKLPRALTAEQREKVCWRNAAELYGIDIPAQLAAQ
jgi:predicted TIM-barrel fold metal-dependent hydrolase